MSVVFTYSYVKKLLDNVTIDNKLTFIQLQIIVSYIDKKLQIMNLLRKKKELIMMDLTLINDIINKLELILKQNLFQDDKVKDVAINLVNDVKKKIEKGGMILC